MTDQNHPNKAQPKVIVITTGGTISCTTDPTGALVPTVAGTTLMQPVADRFAGNLTIEVRELTRLDSSSLTFADLDTIIAACHDALTDPTVVGPSRSTPSTPTPAPSCSPAPKNPTIIPNPMGSLIYSKPS